MKYECHPRQEASSVDADMTEPRVMNLTRQSFLGTMLRDLGVVLLVMVVAVLVRKILLGALGTRIVWVTFYPAVMIAALYGGWLTGLLSAVASCLIALYGWPLMADHPFIKDYGDQLGMFAFLFNCILISAVAEAARRAHARAIQAKEQAEAASHAMLSALGDQKRAEEQLREKEYFLSESQRLGHVGGWHIDVAGQMFWSEETYRLFGVSPGTFIPTAESLFSLIIPDDRPAMQAWIAACAAGEKPGELEFRVNMPDGTIRFIRGHGEAVHDAGHRLLHMAGTAQDITERKLAQAELENVHQQLVEASRRGGMAEIATNVLHNVGNVLNSVNISTGLIAESVKKSRASSLARVVVLLREHAQDLGEFLTHDARGKHVPAHLAQISEHLQADQEAIVIELDELRRNIEHIKEIVAMQQSYATFGGVKEIINVVKLVEDSLRINEGSLSRHAVEVVREFEKVPPLNVEKHKILQILVNLVRNAKYACDESGRADKRMTLRVADGEGRVKISVTDNGIGIPLENLTRIFSHGFTTKKGGHGFGLHGGALAAREMGGSLTAQSDGPGQGASFTLNLPVQPESPIQVLEK